MPNKKNRYDARFPPARIKKIMQSDEDVGKVALAVPVVISRSLELFATSLILKSAEETKYGQSRKLSPCHIKKAIYANNLDFLKYLVNDVPDQVTQDDDDDELLHYNGKNLLTDSTLKRSKQKAAMKTQASLGGFLSKTQSSDEETESDQVAEVETDSNDALHIDSSHNSSPARTHLTNLSEHIDDLLRPKSPAQGVDSNINTSLAEHSSSFPVPQDVGSHVIDPVDHPSSQPIDYSIKNKSSNWHNREQHKPYLPQVRPLVPEVGQFLPNNIAHSSSYFDPHT